jgi:RIO-like serine/threonine protein kinase
MLYQMKMTPKIKRNVIKVCKEIHSRGVYHGDVRGENILVRPNNSVVIIDLERSEMDVDLVSLNEEMLEVNHLLASFI